MIPPLVGCTDTPAAADLLTLMGERASAKEVVIAVQEAVEKLKYHLAEDDIDDEQSTPQLLSLIQLYVAGKHAVTVNTPRLN